MAILKDTTVSGNLRVTDSAIAEKVQTKVINAPTTSGGSTYGPGSNGQVLKSNGTTTYWASDNNSVTGVKGNAESSYRTGQVNLTSANVGAVAVSQGTGNAGKFLMVNSSGNVEATTVATKAATTYNTSTSDQTIAAGTYLTGAQTIKAVTTSGIDATNIKDGAVIKVGDANSATRIKNVTGTFTDAATVSSGQTAAAAAQIRTGYSAWVDGAEVKGSIANLVATTYNTSTSDQTIASGKYISGTQTIKAVTTSNIDAANIKKDVVVTVGDANSATRIKNVTGTFTATPSGKTALTAAALRSGYAGFINGSQVNGSMADTTVTEGTTTVSSTTATRGTWSQTAGYTAARTIAAATFANSATSGATYVDISGTTSAPVLVAGDYMYINKGWTDNLKISLAKLVPDGSDVKGHNEYILSGHSAYDNDGTLVAGTIPTIASTDLTVSGKTVTVPVGYYTGASGATAVTKSVADGAYSASVSSHSVTTTPVVTGSLSGTVTNIGTTTKPSGTDGTDYWTITPSGSVTTTGVSTAKGKATIGTAGYIATGNKESTASTVNITPTVSAGSARYLAKATSSKTNGTASATANAGTASISKQPSASATATANGMDGGYYTDTTTSSYYVDCSASAASGYSTATGGSASASVTASSVTVGAGYNPSSVTASTTASSTGNKTGNTATSTEVTASTSKKIYLKPATIAGSSTNATATTTVAPGTVSIAKQNVPSGVTQAASGNATTTAPSSGVYVAVKATATANTTGTTSAISGSGTATVTGAGYAPTTLTGTVSVSGTATAKTSAKDSSMTYVPITTANPAFDGGTLSGSSTASSSQITMDTTSTTAGVKIQTEYSASSDDVLYNGAVAGWVSKADDTVALAGKMKTAPGTTYYVTAVTIPKDKGFTVTTTADSALDTTSDLDVYNNAYRRVDITNRANGTVLVANSGTSTITSGSATAGTLTVNAYDNASTPALTGAKTVVSAGKWNMPSVSGTGTYYGRVTVGAVSGFIGGTASSGSATAAITNVNSMNTITDISGKTAGTDYWTVKATATGNAGSYTPKYTVSTAGWLASTVTGSAHTVSVNADTTGKSIYIPKATITGSSINATATTTVAPGTVSISKQDVPSGVTQAASGDATTTAPSSGVYVAVKATATANSTGTTSSISGSGSATVSTAGYAPTTLTGTVSVSGTATAKTSAKDSSVTYVPITTATPTFSSPTPSGGSTATGTNVTLSTTDNGMKVQTAYTVNQASVTYNAAVNGWVNKASGVEAVKTTARSATNGTAYYVTAVKMPKDKGFTVTTVADTVLDTTSDLDVTNNAYRRVDITNNANGVVVVTGAGSTDFTSGSDTTGDLVVNAYNGTTASGDKSIVSAGKWVTPSVSGAGTYYGKTVIPQASPTFTGGAMTVQNTYGMSGTLDFSTTVNNSNVSLVVETESSRGDVKRSNNVHGWVESSKDTVILNSSYDYDTQDVYINGITLAKATAPRSTNTFTITVPDGTLSTATFTFTVDSNGDVTIE